MGIKHFFAYTSLILVKIVILCIWGTSFCTAKCQVRRSSETSGNVRVYLAC